VRFGSARRGAGWNARAPAASIVEQRIDFDGRPAARIEDLPRIQCANRQRLHVMKLS
jgi:hypothetical protein